MCTNILDKSSWTEIIVLRLIREITHGLSTEKKIQKLLKEMCNLSLRMLKQIKVLSTKRCFQRIKQIGLFLFNCAKILKSNLSADSLL
jgi:hypothetical protein